MRRDRLSWNWITGLVIRKKGPIYDVPVYIGDDLLGYADSESLAQDYIDIPVNTRVLRTGIRQKVIMER